MILSDRDIRAAMQRLEDPLIVDPGFAANRLQPASLELTLAHDVLIDTGSTWDFDSGRKVERPYVVSKIPIAGKALYPQDFWLASTVEKIHIPRDLVAQVNGKSSHARKGLVVHQTAGFIDPGFKGTVTLELSNASRNPILLKAGMPICQLVFFQLSSPAERPYGSEGLGSHYQDQVGPTQSAS